MAHKRDDGILGLVAALVALALVLAVFWKIERNCAARECPEGMRAKTVHYACICVVEPGRGADDGKAH